MSRRNVGVVVQGAENPIGPAGGSLGGTYPNPTVVQIDGTAGTAAINATVLQWVASAATPTITQASESTAIKGADMTFTPQQSTHVTDQGGGNAIFALQAPAGAGAEAALVIKRGATAMLSLGAWATAPTTYGAVWVGSAVPSASNMSLYGDGISTTNLSSPALLQFIVGGVAVASMSTLVRLGLPVGGLSATPFSWSGQTSPNTVAGGTGGTQTISAAQAIVPFFLLTTGTLTSSVVVDFGTNAVTGYFIIDISGVGTLGAFTVGFKNGTTTKTITATQLANLVATGATAVQVWTYGTNNLTLVS